jgi:hypothetical protein
MKVFNRIFVSCSLLGWLFPCIGSEIKYAYTPEDFSSSEGSPSLSGNQVQVPGSLFFYIPGTGSFNGSGALTDPFHPIYGREGFNDSGAGQTEVPRVNPFYSNYGTGLNDESERRATNELGIGGTSSFRQKTICAQLLSFGSRAVSVIGKFCCLCTSRRPC